jgi:hypothetical protein
MLRRHEIVNLAEFKLRHYPSTLSTVHRDAETLIAEAAA